MSKVELQTFSKLILNYPSRVISPKVISYKKPLSASILSFRNKSFRSMATTMVERFSLDGGAAR